MYTVSNDYLTAMLAPTRQHRLTGTIGTLAFTDADIVRDTFTVSGQAMDRSDIHFGGVFIGQLKMTVLPTFGITRTEWQGKTITPSIGLKIGSTTWEDIPLGIYTVAEAKWSATGVQLTAYDNMAKFDKAFPGIDVWQDRTPYQYLLGMCADCGVTFGMTKAQVEAFPNGTEVLGIHKDNDIETWRDLLSWIAQALAGFATINRAGQLEIRKFGTPTGLTLDATHRFAGSVISDFSTHYTGVGLTLITQNSYYYKAATVDDGETMKLGENPLLQHYLSVEIDRLLQPILDELANFEFTPFKSGLLGDVALDLGDAVEFTDGLANDDQVCVMAYTYRFARSYSAEGYGDNPALADARSKVSKSLSGIRSTVSNQSRSIEELEQSAIKFLIPREISTAPISDGSFNTVAIWTIQCADNAQVSAVATLGFEVTLTGSDDALVKAVIRIDDVALETYRAEYGEGEHVLTISHLMTLEIGSIYTISLELWVEGGDLA